ncbi:MAG TPA: FAD-dependent oxidoreductase [Thermoanaerobaculia bacterium]|jgi:glycine/D-amino acid oxidase-like deaminating enzyme/nitrite reductase/ring-hydroxylating ferredoxin subunit
MDQETTSLWLATTVPPRYEPLRHDLHVDVAIIGGGIAGLTAAVLLKERGRKVAVLERQHVGGGETGNTTAHITEAVDARYHFLKRNFDLDAAKTMAEASRAAIERIATNVERFGIECRFRRVPGYLYTEKRKYVAELKNEAVSAKDAGCDARWVTDVPLPFPTRGAVLFENQAQFHPMSYLSGLAARVPGDGSYIFEQTQATAVTEGEPCVVETPHGRITADSVFMATNVPIAGFQTVHTKNAPYRTYAMAFHMTGPHPDGLFWDTADPYHYTRWQETDQGDYMIVGGEDHKVGHEEDTEACFARLQQYTLEQFGAHPLRYRWSGQVIEPHDGVPFIGGHGKLYISTGYAGQGMTLGTVGGMLVTDLITGVENPWAKLFDPMRIHLRGATVDYVKQNAEFPARLLRDRLTSGNVETDDTFDVKSGEGKIVKVGGRKLAVYRDEAGALTACSTVCTHMKCDVSWNAAEKSWDCPCHGSRFRPDGAVLNGPAKEPLEKVALEDVAGGERQDQ